MDPVRCSAGRSVRVRDGGPSNQQGDSGPRRFEAVKSVEEVRRANVAKAARYRAMHPERVKASRDRCRAAHRDRYRPAALAWAAAHRSQENACVAVCRAVRRGVLVRPAVCDCCGQPGRIEAHHHHGYDVAYRLDVVWLCKSCHTQTRSVRGRSKT